jgi:hypothetical protein
MNSNKIIKLLLIFMSVYGSIYFVDNYDYKILEKTLLLTAIITFINFIYPTI